MKLIKPNLTNPAPATKISSPLNHAFSWFKDPQISRGWEIGILALILLFHSLITYYNLYTRYIYFEMREPTDSAAYMQVAWSIVFGTPFTISVQENWISVFPHNFLGDQLMFTLMLFSPFLWITSSGLIFLVFQTLIITIGGFLLYLFARIKLNDSLIPLLLTTAFLFNTATFSSFAFFGFRGETLFIPLIFGMFIFIEKNRPIFAAFFLLLILLTKHNAIVISFLLGLYFLLFDREKWRFGIFCLIAASAYYLVGVELIMSNFQENPQAHFKHFKKFGNSPLEALWNIALNPMKILSMISNNEIVYIGLIFFPAAFLSLFHPVFWISLPQIIMILTLSDYGSISCGWHWALVVPFIFIGMVYSFRFIFNSISKSPFPKYLITTLLIIGIFIHFTSFKINILEAKEDYYFKKNKINTNRIISPLKLIDPDASVMVSGQLLWFFFNREHVFNSRVKFHEDVEYIAILLPIGHPHYQNIDKHIILEINKELKNRESKFKSFDLIGRDKNLIVFKKKKLG